MTFVGGYTVFIDDNWDIPTFLFSYTMIGVFPVLFVGWKVLKKTRWLKPGEVDLRKDVEEIEAYTREFVAEPPKYDTSS
jgi:yeast amino acid transporter